MGEGESGWGERDGGEWGRGSLGKKHKQGYLCQFFGLMVNS